MVIGCVDSVTEWISAVGTVLQNGYRLWGQCDKMDIGCGDSVTERISAVGTV
jgi:hypothetical protein